MKTYGKYNTLIRFMAAWMSLVTLILVANSPLRILALFSVFTAFIYISILEKVFPRNAARSNNNVSAPRENLPHDSKKPS